jgi:PAS domain S-box-containing protein
LESRLFRPPAPSTSEEEAARRELASRLDDLRGLGILPSGTEATSLDHDGDLLALTRSLVDVLEATQRRVIETSIQLLSLRELVAKLLSLRTPEEVAETVTLYLHKAFDHERVLVGVYDPARESLEGWVAVRNGVSRCRPFTLEGSWGGNLRRSLEDHAPLSGSPGGDGPPFVTGRELPDEMAPFAPNELGPYQIYPLNGRGRTQNKVVGVLAVGRRHGVHPGSSLENGILESVVEAVSTAMENVILEEDVRREQAFREDIMRSMASGMVAVDLAGRVLTVNAAAEKLTGLSLVELRGGDTRRLDPPGGGLTELLRKTLRNRRGIRRVERAVARADGSAFPAACATTLLRNPVGEIYGAVAIFDDLSEIKEMEARIRALDRLAALGRFTAGIAHEIRNPLTGIGTGVQYLARHIGDDPEQRENLEFIEREIERLNRIVEDLFRVTHPHPLRKSPESVQGLVDRALRSVGSAPAERGLDLRVKLAEDLPEVPVDPDQIHQVLLNLIKNAVEATPEGGKVEIRACAPAADDGRPRLAIQVMDTGPGIDPEDLAHVFEPFFTKGKAGGTGLGLYVSHGIVERHGGELHAANAHKGGAVFTVKLPLDRFEATEITG